MAKARKLGVNVPFLMDVDIDTNTIIMEYINGI